MAGEYTGLHQHSVYSVLDGFGKIDGIVERCKYLGMKGVVLTDHGNQFGAYELNKTCKKHGIKPIFANETYMAPGSALVKEKVEGFKPAYHLIMIAMNDIGYKNLMRLTSWSWTQGKYYKPRVDLSKLAEWNEGLIITSACLGGFPSQLFLQGREEDSEDKILEFKRIFGDRYYLELTHTGMEEQTLANNFLVSMAQKHNIELIITADSHYVAKEDTDYHATLVAINTGSLHKKKISDDGDQDESGLYYQKGQYFIKSYQDLKDMYLEYHGEEFMPIFEKAMANTNDIADKCNVTFKEGLKIIPQIIDNPHEELVYQCENYLDEHLVALGYKEIVSDTPDCIEYLILNSEKCTEYSDRLAHELDVITKMEFGDYFHVVSEYTQWAKDSGIMVGSGRGSAAGSLVAFCMRITGIDPIKYDLLFERFLNRGRAKRPLIEFDGYPMEKFLEETNNEKI
jgi:DNA polymerase-3 subunit alpha